MLNDEFSAVGDGVKLLEERVANHGKQRDGSGGLSFRREYLERLGGEIDVLPAQCMRFAWHAQAGKPRQLENKPHFAGQLVRDGACRTPVNELHSLPVSTDVRFLIGQHIVGNELRANRRPQNVLDDFHALPGRCRSKLRRQEGAESVAVAGCDLV